MRRRGGREINIFNIAFLDVITGALGAFVLLVVMLSANVKQGAGAGGSSFRPDGDQRTPAATQTDTDVQALRQANKALSQANQTLTQANQALSQATQDLKSRNEAQREKIAQMATIKPLVVITEWDCRAAKIEVYMKALDKLDDGREMPPFDPSTANPAAFMGSSAHYDADPFFRAFSSTDTWLYASVPRQRFRLYYYLIPPFTKDFCQVSSFLLNGVHAPFTGAELSAQRPWASPGIVSIGKEGEIDVDLAKADALTPVERENTDRWLAKTASARLQIKQ